MPLQRAVTLLISAAIALSACGGTAASDSADVLVPAAFGDSAADGEALANAWFELLSLTGSSDGSITVTPEEARKGAELVKPYLDPAFQLQRSTGQRYTRDDYVPSDIDGFEIADMHVTEPRQGVKVLRYAVRTPGATLLDSNMVMSDELQPRLTVMRWDEELERWLIVSHANFNTPIQAVCNQEPVAVNAVEVPTSDSDRELGEALARRVYALLEQGDASPIYHPEVQVQTGGGFGFSTTAEYTPGQMQRATLSDYVVTRNGDLIVVTMGVVPEGNVFNGITELSAQENPRMLTFLEDEEGEWKMISGAVFSPPAQVPAEVDCA